ncbi:MAG: DUF1203 domain-containing protein [Acidimicrobiales bacterium]
MTPTFEVRPIEPGVLQQLRERDDAGRRPALVVDHDGGSPLRCCLRLSRPGEEVALVSYAPLRRWAAEAGADPGAYDEVGPVFIHREPCPGLQQEGYPEELRRARRVFRCYSSSGQIVCGRPVEPGDRAEEVIEELLALPDTAVVHVRALEFGCFTFEVRRVS